MGMRSFAQEIGPAKVAAAAGPSRPDGRGVFSNGGSPIAMTSHTRPLRCLFVAAAVCLPALFLGAATYLPMSDVDLARGAPVIVHASVVALETRLEPINGESLPVTFVTLRRLEALKGAAPETLTLRLPGDHLADQTWWVPGTPVFSPGQEVVLMLAAFTRAPRTIPPHRARPVAVQRRRRRRRPPLRRADRVHQRRRPGRLQAGSCVRRPPRAGRRVVPRVPARGRPRRGVARDRLRATPRPGRRKPRHRAFEMGEHRRTRAGRLLGGARRASSCGTGTPEPRPTPCSR